MVSGEVGIGRKAVMKVSTFFVIVLAFSLIVFNIIITSTDVFAQDDENLPTFSGNMTNTTMAGEGINFTMSVNDDVQLNSSAGYIFSTNNTGTWKNTSFVYFTGTANTMTAWNITTLNDTVRLIVQWKFYANDTSDNWNASETYNLTTTTRKEFNITIYNSTAGIGDTSIKIYNYTNELVAAGGGELSVNLTQYENYTLELSENINGENLTVRIVDLNIADNLNITTQTVKDYTYDIPSGYNKITSVFAFDDAGLSYSYATIYIPNESFTVTKILHCNNAWNYGGGNCNTVGDWEVDDPSTYNAESNSTHTYFNVTGFDGYGGGGNVYLEVELVLPPGDTFVQRYTTFNVNATVHCRGGACNDVYGTSRYNLTTEYPDTAVNTTYGEEPFFVNETPANAQKACPTNSLDEDEFCNITWKINATGDLDSEWDFGVLFNSTDTEIQNNNTDNVTLTIVPCLEEITIQFSDISFSTLFPNTQGNAASGNSNDFYNVTNSGTCTSNLWVKSTDIEKGSDSILYSNISFNNVTNDFASSYRVGDSFSSDNSTFKRDVAGSTNATGYYFLDVAIVYTGDYEGNVTFCFNSSLRGTICQ